MALRDAFEREGTWLFRHRSYIPLLLLAAFLIAVHGFDTAPGGGLQRTLWKGLCVSVALAGLGIRVVTVAFLSADTSGRSTRGHAAAALNTTGSYSVVRHPLYLGNYLMWIGIAAFPGMWGPPMVATLVFWLYYERIMFAEEEFLRRRFPDEFARWASATPAFVPRLSRWRPPQGRFSIREVLWREYSGLFGLVTCFTVLEFVGGMDGGALPAVDPLWLGAFAAAGIWYLATVAVKKAVRYVNLQRERQALDVVDRWNRRRRAATGRSVTEA